jgi:hypothetical protein
LPYFANWITTAEKIWKYIDSEKVGFHRSSTIDIEHGARELELLLTRDSYLGSKIPPFYQKRWDSVLYTKRCQIESSKELLQIVKKRKATVVKE